MFLFGKLKPEVWALLGFLDAFPSNITWKARKTLGSGSKGSGSGFSLEGRQSLYGPAGGCVSVRGKGVLLFN